MSKAPKKGASSRAPPSTSTNADFLKTEQPLQAVLLADSFKIKLRPITAEKPKVLLPLATIPMLEYSLEFLARGGVQEIFVFCVAHADVVKSYLETSKWKRMQNVRVRTIVDENALSAGDALRYLDRADLIKGDFVLLSGDVISNIKLDKVLAAHKRRVAEDKRNMMTIVLKRATRTHRTRTLDDDLVVAISSESGQLLSYENDSKNKGIELPVDVVTSHPSVQFRHDLMDTHIDICSPGVLNLFTDNFDYQDIREDFIRGVLGSEILGDKIFTHVISGEYAARLQDLRTYDSVSKDVIHRWTYPMVPDNNLFDPSTTFRYYRHNIYREENLQLARDCVIGEDSVIGANVTIGAKSHIHSTVIGRDCVIGQGCTITGSYLWGKVTIEDGVVIDRAILCDGVIVRKGAKIERGVVLSFNVIIGPNFTVPAYRKITTSTITASQDEDEDEDEDESEDEDSDNDKQIKTEKTTIETSTSTQHGWRIEDVGIGGVGRIYESKEDHPESSTYTYNSIAPDLERWKQQHQHDLDYESSNDEDEDIPPSTVEDFFKEVRDTLARGITDKLDVEGIVIEMSSLKLAHDASLQDYAMATFLTMFEFIGLPETPKPVWGVQDAPRSSSKAPLKPTKAMGTSLQKLIKSWSLVLAKFAKDQEDQVNYIFGLENTCMVADSIYGGLFVITLNALYNEDVVSEEAILEWEEIRKQDTASSASYVYLTRSKAFLEALKEASSEEESSEEESDED